MTQRCRVSSNFSLVWRGNTGRLASLTLMLRLAAIASPLARRGHERARRDVAVDIGMIERVELNPKHVGFEDQRIAYRFALGRRRRMLFHIFQREISVARRLFHAAAEMAHD